MESKGKTREEVIAEREARKKAKLAKKKPKQNDTIVNDVAKSTQIKDSTVRNTVTDGCAESPAPAVKHVRKTVTDCSPVVAPRVNDLVDGCVLQERRVFFGSPNQEINMLTKGIQEKAVIVDDNVSVDLRKLNVTQVKTMAKDVTSASTVTVLSTAEPAKSKAELKAERRAKQEAQRAAKTAAKILPAKMTSPKPPEVKPAKSAIKKPTVKTESEGKSKSVTFASSSTKQASQNKIKLFSHLYREKNINYKSILNSSDLHPAIVGLGIQYSNRVIVGSNARCVALLHVLKKMLSDYKTPAEKEFSRGFEAKLEPSINYLNQCRPISVSMTNALKHIKWHLTQLPNNITDVEARLKMSSVITTYVKEQIEVAGEAISLYVRKKIANGDVILTFGCSSLVERILKDAHEVGIDFSVVIIDSAPWFEGKEMLRRLVKAKIPCTYVLISAASFIMKQASKVILGAHALLANGCVMSRSGTALVALLANTANVPVLVCCETHKFSERVQTDAFVYNELGDPDELVSNSSPVNGWESNNYLVPLSLVYDVTPPDLVTAVVTELAILPCTSVPVVLRVKPTESSA